MPFLAKLRQKFWWFDVIYPLAVAALVFWSITTIVFEGKPSSRLALKVEEALLNWSLSWASPPKPRRPGAVAVVSIDSVGMHAYPKAPRGVVPDVDASVYAAILRQVVRLQPKHIILFWNGDTQRVDAEYLTPLVAAVEELPPSITLTLAVTGASTGDLGARFSARTRILDGSSCFYPEWSVVHSYCSHAPMFKDLLVQQLAEDWGRQGSSEERSWLTRDLPSNSPTFITALPRTEALTQIPFGALLAADPAVSPSEPPDYVLIGTDVSGSLSPASRGEAQHFVRTVQDSWDTDPRLNGTPLTVYFAKLIQMFLDDATIKVPTPLESLFVTITLGLMIIGLMIRFGGATAVGVFAVYVLAGPWVNAWSLGMCQAYVPLFASTYVGGSILLVISLVRLSVTGWRKWRAQARVQALSEAAELKSHFIALMSHNLNTPVAKMQGMLAILLQHSKDPAVRDSWRMAQHATTELKLAIRAVLVASALEERSITLSPRTAGGLAEEFLSTFGTTLRQAGISLSVLPVAVSPEDAEDLAWVPVPVDVRALTTALAAAAYLLGPERGSQPPVPLAVTIRITVRETPPDLDGSSSGGYGFQFNVTAPGRTLSPAVMASLAGRGSQSVREQTGESFLQDVLAGLLAVTARTFAGTLTVRDAETISFTVERPLQ